MNEIITLVVASLFLLTLIFLVLLDIAKNG